MKTQIRHGVFETNSSSTHAVAILNDEEYKKYKRGEIVISRNGNFITEEEFEAIKERARQKRIERITEEWNNQMNRNYYYLHKAYKTLESAIENINDDDIYSDELYEYDDSTMEIEHAEREFNGEKVHALSVYGYES